MISPLISDKLAIRVKTSATSRLFIASVSQDLLPLRPVSTTMEYLHSYTRLPRILSSGSGFLGFGGGLQEIKFEEIKCEGQDEIGGHPVGIPVVLKSGKDKEQPGGG